MATGLTSAATSLVDFGTASQVAAPKIRSANMQMREITTSAQETGRAMAQMGMIAKQGLGSMPQMALAFWDASRGVNQLAAGMVAIGPSARVATLALGGIAVGVAAIGAAVIAYGVSVFRMAKEMDQLDKTSKSLGMGFATLKVAQDQAKAIGESADVVTRNFQGIQAAQLDLYKNNSELRQKLLSQGVKEQWIREFSTADPTQAFNMIREFGKRLEKSMIDAGAMPSVAKAMVDQFGKEFGVHVGDLPELKKASPEAAANLERVKVLSVEVMEIWDPLSVKLETLELEGLKVGLPLLVNIMENTDAIIGRIQYEINEVVGVFKAVGFIFNLINHPLDTLSNLTQEQKDSAVDFLDPAIRRHLAPVTNVAKFADIGSGGSSANDNSIPKSWGNNSVWDSFRKSDNIEDRRDEITEDNVKETGSLTQQLERLNAFFDRLEANSVLGGGGGGGGLGFGGGGGGGLGLGLLGGVGGGYGGGGGGTPGAPGGPAGPGSSPGSAGSRPSARSSGNDDAGSKPPATGSTPDTTGSERPAETASEVLAAAAEDKDVGGASITGKTSVAALERNAKAQAAIARFKRAFPNMKNVKGQIYDLIKGESGMGRNMTQRNQYAGYFALGSDEAYAKMGLTKQQFAALPFEKQMDAYTTWAKRNDPSGNKLKDLGLFNAASNMALQGAPDSTVVYDPAKGGFQAKAAAANASTWGKASGQVGGPITIGGIKKYYNREFNQTVREIAAAGGNADSPPAAAVTAANSNIPELAGKPVKPGPTMERAALDRASTTNANKPTINGGLKADVDAPANTKVEVEGKGAFKDTETTRSTTMSKETANKLLATG